MPAVLLVLVLLLAGSAPGGLRPDGISTAEEPFTLVALDVGQPRFRIRCLTVRRPRRGSFAVGTRHDPSVGWLRHRASIHTALERSPAPARLGANLPA